MKASVRRLVRRRADQRCEYCRLHESDQPLLFHVDGEPVQGGKRVRVRVHPGALRVAVK